MVTETTNAYVRVAGGEWSRRLISAATIPFLPPTSNKMYKRTPFGPKLSKEAEAFIRKAAPLLMDQFDLMVQLDQERLYGYRIEFVIPFPQIANKTWPKKALTKFKKMDVSNRVKVLEDVIMKTLGIDDSLFFLEEISKVPGPDPEVRIWIYEVKNDVGFERLNQWFEQNRAGSANSGATRSPRKKKPPALSANTDIFG